MGSALDELLESCEALHPRALVRSGARGRTWTPRFSRLRAPRRCFATGGISKPSLTPRGRRSATLHLSSARLPLQAAPPISRLERRKRWRCTSAPSGRDVRGRGARCELGSAGLHDRPRAARRLSSSYRAVQRSRLWRSARIRARGGSWVLASSSGRASSTSIRLTSRASSCRPSTILLSVRRS